MNPYYQDGSVTIYHGDCKDVLPTLAKADLVIADPPYGLGECQAKNSSRGNRVRFKSKRGRAVFVPATEYGAYEWDNEPASSEEIQLTIASAKNAIIFGGNYFSLPPSRGWLVWDKLNSGDFAACELAWTNLKMSVRIFRFMWNGMLRDGEQRGVPRVHPTQKPVELMQWCLSFAPNAQSIIDPFMGSGTTLRAAKNLGRKAIGIEGEEKYCEIAAKRMSQEVFDFGT